VFEEVHGGVNVDEDEEDNGEDAMNAYLHAHLKSQTSSYSNTAPVLQLSKTVSFQQDHSLPLAVRPKGRPHILQAQSLARSDNSLSSLSYAPSSHRSEAQGNIFGTSTNVAPTGLQPLISQGSTHIQLQSHHHSSLDNVQHLPLYDLMQQQTNIIAQLVQNQALASLPPRAIPEFDGGLSLSSTTSYSRV